ncbi:fumarylacetoacetate hydrolase family protein [Paludisphaera rhizosphaerae]|uniref:fumarylacetoacetate hydrolase family protein n=1 Tax=Paludisphaera rhizosphaerae TaxID=2711216 RepID=UPI0013EDBDB0|nr:fumarylacetoacetate hydrolase family protein [Paludisphaera rhizosphaerae]
MRVCRFRCDDLVLTGFYRDDAVIPLDQAAELYSRETGDEMLLADTEDLLDLLPPNGPSFQQARRLYEWVEDLDVIALNELTMPRAEVDLLVPLPSPSKMLFLAGNYSKHLVERGYMSTERQETFPYVFTKPPSTTLTHPGDPIVIPAISPDQIDWECELGVVIGKRCKNVSEQDALKYVAGYTVVNDVSDRSFRPNPDRKARERDKFFDWLHGKWHDTFCPMGPCILSADSVADPQALPIKLTVNDEVKQNATTAEMVFPVAAVVEFVSRFITLEPGDVIATGTPSGVGSATGVFLKPGDVVRATIAPIGTLVNPVRGENEGEFRPSDLR